MTKRYIRNMIQIFSMVFTFVSLLNFLFGKTLTPAFVNSVCVVAFISALCSIVFYDISPVNKMNPLLVTVIYIGVIVSTVTGVIVYAGGAKFNSNMLVGNVLLVFIVYGVIRWVTFAEDKKEADKINQALKKLREKKE